MLPSRGVKLPTGDAGAELPMPAGVPVKSMADDEEESRDDGCVCQCKCSGGGSIP